MVKEQEKRLTLDEHDDFFLSLSLLTMAPSLIETN